MSVLPLMKACLVSLFLGGCAVAGMGASAPPATYNLSAPSLADLQTKRWPIQLTVLRPTAMRAFDTDRIVVMAPGGRLSYFEDAAWSDRLTNLLQSRIVEAMQDSKAFRAVLTTQDRVDGDYVLALEVRAFQVDVDNGHTSATVTLFAKIIQEHRSRVVATSEFSAQMPADKDNPDSGVAALQGSFNQVTRDLIRWVASSPNGRTGA